MTPRRVKRICDDVIVICKKENLAQRGGPQEDLVRGGGVTAGEATIGQDDGL